MSRLSSWIESYKLYREIRQDVTHYKARNGPSRGLAPTTVYDTPTSSVSTSPGRSPRVLAQYGYIGNPVVYRAINVIADECSAIPLLVKTRGANGKVQENSPLNFILKQPNMDKAKGAYIEQMIKYWLISGTTFTYMATGATSSVRSFQPAALYQLRPDLITVQADELNGVTGFRYETGKTRTDYTPMQVKPIHFFHPLDDFHGLSPITVASVIIDRQNEGEAWNASFMKHAARPSGAFVIPGMLGEEEYGRMRREIMTKYTGKNAAGSPLLLEGGLTYIQTGNNPLDADWNNSDANAGRKIAMAIGVDPLLLNDKEHSTYNNVTEARIALIDITVHPMMSRIIDEWNMWLAPRFGGDLEISLDQQYLDRIHDDVSATSLRVQNEFMKGLLSWNTAQQLTGRTSMPWGEFYQMGPQTYVAASNMQEYLDKQHESRVSASTALQGLPQGTQVTPVPDPKTPPLALPAPKTPPAKKGWEALQPTNALVEYSLHLKTIRDKWVPQFQAALQHHRDTNESAMYLPELFLKYYANIAEDACELHTTALQVKATVYTKDVLSILARYAALHLEEIEGVDVQDCYTLATKEVNVAMNVGLYTTAIMLATGLQKTWVAFDGESACQLHEKLHGASTGLTTHYTGGGTPVLFPDTGLCGCSCMYSLTAETKFNPNHTRSGQFGTAVGHAPGGYEDIHGQIEAGQGVLFARAVPKAPTFKKFHEPFKTDVITEEECLNSEHTLGELLDKDNSIESAGATKKRISEVLAAELKGDVQYQALVKELSDRASYEHGDTADVRVTSYLVHKWAETSADNDEMSVAIQDAAIKAFHLTNTTMKGIPTHLTEVDGYNEYLGTPGLQSFVKAQYNVTQKFFKANNITSVIAYRGMSWSAKPPGGTASFATNHGEYITVKTRPLNPFSTTLETAKGFTQYGQERYPKMMVIATRIPVSRILGSAQTGVGCKEESEIVVLGGKDTVFSYKATGYVSLYPSNLTEIMQETALAGKSMKSDEIYYIDEDPYNADWTKQSWDLPVSNIQELRQWLQTSGKTVEEFIHLPVYQLNKHKFVWLATLEDTPQKNFSEEKFNPNHTRSGQFGTVTNVSATQAQHDAMYGATPAPSEHAHFKTLKEAEDHLQEVFPGMTVDFKLCKLSLINEALPDFEKAAKQFDASKNIVFLGTGEGKKTPEVFAPQVLDGAMATTARAQGKGGSIQYAITLQEKYWNHTEVMHKELKAMGTTGWSTVKEPHAGYLLVHELGHVVTINMFEEHNNMAITSKAGGFYDSGMVKGATKYWIQTHDTALIHASGYSTTGFLNSRLPYEPLAEVFTGAFYKQPKKIFKSFQNAMDVIIPGGSEKGWSLNYGPSATVNKDDKSIQNIETLLQKSSEDEEVWFDWTETLQFPENTEEKFNPNHDRRGLFGTRVGVAAGQIEDAGSMAYFNAKDQGKINAYASANGISASYGISASTKLIEASKASGHYEADADWYNRANSASNALSGMLGITKEQSAGIIAAMSPRNKWDGMSKEGMVRKPNIKDAIIITKMFQANPVITITPELAAHIKPYDKSSGNLSERVGLTQHLNDFTPTEASYLTTGHISGFAVNTAKSFRILKGEPVEKVLGGSKVRSFYNNIHEPTERSSVTVDTWMVRILSGKSKATPNELSALLSHPGGGALKGIGSYPLYADMIKSVAKTYNIAPHAAQAVIWEQARREQGAGVTLADVPVKDWSDDIAWD